MPDKKSFVVNYIFTSLVLAFTITSLIVAWKAGPAWLNKPNVEKRIGTLYNNVKTDHWSYFTFTTAFCVRRILFVLIVFQPVSFIKVPLV